MNIEQLLNEYRKYEDEYPQAKAHRVYLEEFKKSKLAMLMSQAEKRGHKTVSAQEREALADQAYMDFVESLGVAVEREEKCRYHIKRLEMEIEVWRTEQANERFERKTYGG